MSDKEKKRILVLLSAVTSLLIMLVVYLSYFQVFEAEKYRTSAQNRRNSIEQERVLRGAIYDRNGLTLAQSEFQEDGSNKRIYSHPNLYSHIIGYSYKDLGKSGLELKMDEYLLNNNSLGIVDAIKRYFNRESVGNAVSITIDTGIQKKASTLLDGKKGSIVAMNPKTGEIYAMVSKPDFNAQTLRENWEAINADKNSPLFNRAINGLYPPGSVFKIISTAAILESNVDLDYKHTGEQTIDGYKYKDASDRVYGDIGLEIAFTRSLNTYFVEKIQGVGKNKLGQVTDNFMFNQKIPFDLPVTNSTFNHSKSIGPTLLAATSIGQGELLATPLQMALMTSAIANNGIMMEPYVVKEVTSPTGIVLRSESSRELKTSIPASVASEIKELMVLTTNEGTGKRAALNGIQVAGKTGTAQNEGESTHAWYVGFAPAENPVVAIAIVIEQGGSGGVDAAPMAKALFQSVFDNLNIVQ